ncbi:hypothetical protein [Kibdelosporangium philippinense]|uniref:hypothetical protein n=1 Tax=Kibdelosporangium philippinense TaxID=211113 RepID=UPI00361CF5E7
MFFDWLYVMSARSLAAALPSAWNMPSRRRARLFALNGSHMVGRVPVWASLFGRKLATRPTAWRRFWKDVARCGPDNGVRWRTLAGENNRPDRVLVLDNDEEREWSLGRLLDQPWRELKQGRPSYADTIVDEPVDIGGNERLLLHIPESALT